MNDEYNKLLAKAVKATYGPSDLEQEARAVLDETGLTPRELNDLHDELVQTLTTQSTLIEKIANILKGKPPENTLHSWHDLPKLVGELKAERDELREEIMLFLDTFRYAADELQALAGKGE